MAATEEGGPADKPDPDPVPAPERDERPLSIVPVAAGPTQAGAQWPMAWGGGPFCSCPADPRLPALSREPTGVDAPASRGAHCDGCVTAPSPCAPCSRTERKGKPEASRDLFSETRPCTMVCDVCSLPWVSSTAL